MFLDKEVLLIIREIHNARMVRSSFQMKNLSLWLIRSLSINRGTKTAFFKTWMF